MDDIIPVVVALGCFAAGMVGGLVARRRGREDCASTVSVHIWSQPVRFDRCQALADPRCIAGNCTAHCRDHCKDRCDAT